MSSLHKTIGTAQSFISLLVASMLFAVGSKLSLPSRAELMIQKLGDGFQSCNQHALHATAVKCNTRQST